MVLSNYLTMRFEYSNRLMKSINVEMVKQPRKVIEWLILTKENEYSQRY